MLVKDYIYITNILPKSICEEVIKIIEFRDWDKHAWYSNKNSSTHIENEKELDTQLTDQALHEKLAPYIIQAGTQYNNKFAVPGTRMGQFISQFTPARFNRYQPGTMMRKHYDHIHHIFDGEQKGIPVLSMLGVLNEDFKGGEFLVNEEVYPLKTGDMILFPSCFMYPHEVKEVTEGTRFSFISWAY